MNKNKNKFLLEVDGEYYGIYDTKLDAKNAALKEYLKMANEQYDEGRNIDVEDILHELGDLVNCDYVDDYIYIIPVDYYPSEV